MSYAGGVSQQIGEPLKDFPGPSQGRISSSSTVSPAVPIKRLQNIFRHLIGIQANTPSPLSQEEFKRKISPANPISSNGLPTYNNREQFKKLLDSEAPSLIPELTFLYEALKCSRARNHNSTTEEHRRQTRQQLEEVASHGILSVEKVADHFDTPLLFQAAELMALLNPSTATLVGVHFTLWGLSVYKIGTEKHWKAYLEKSNTLEILGCCMMTEIGHGSNVRGLETKATFDFKTREFVLHTPKPSATKIFIGGAVQNATHGVVFAQLVLNGEEKGVHAFVVHMREGGRNLPGIITWDIGRKIGLNGIDNGCVRFDQARIPYDNLLDRYCEINEKGEYVPKKGNKDPQTLIYPMMSQFVRGRQTITQSSTMSLKLQTTLFYLYPPLSIGKEYHQRLLTEKIAKAYAMAFSRPVYMGKYVDDHIRASMMKPISSRMAMEEFMENIRWYENLGTSAVLDVLVDYRGDSDATLTFEGDNIVLLQMDAQAVLKDVARCSARWIEGLKTLNIHSYKKAIEWFYYRNEPEYLLKWEVLQIARCIGAKMKSCKTDLEKFNMWTRSCQVEAIEMAKMYAQILILKEYQKKAAQLDKEERTTMWGSLYKIYATKTACELLKLSVLDLEKEYSVLKKHLPKLIARFGVRLEWVDAILSPPDVSFPYEEKPPTFVPDFLARL